MGSISVNCPLSDSIRDSHGLIQIGPTWSPWTNPFGAQTLRPNCAYFEPTMKCWLRMSNQWVQYWIMAAIGVKGVIEVQGPPKIMHGPPLDLSSISLEKEHAERDCGDHSITPSATPVQLRWQASAPYPQCHGSKMPSNMQLSSDLWLCSLPHTNAHNHTCRNTHHLPNGSRFCGFYWIFWLPAHASV